MNKKHSIVINSTLWWLICTIVASLSAVTSHAGIYRCVDANGRPAFSNTPCPDTAIKGNSPAHQLWREMRTLVSKGRSISQQLNADAQSILTCNRKSAAFGKQLDDVESRLSRLSPVTHKALFKAMDYLRACAQCRVAATNDCKKANTQLNEQMNVLLMNR